VQFIELLKADDFLESLSVLFELSFDVGTQVGIDVVWAFTDKPEVEDEQHCFLCATDEFELGLLLLAAVLQWFQRQVVQLLDLVSDVPIGQKHALGEFRQLEPSLPLVFDANDSPVDDCQFARPILVLPVERFPEGQRLDPGQQDKLADQLFLQVKGIEDCLFQEAHHPLLLPLLVAPLQPTHRLASQHSIAAAGLQTQLRGLVMVQSDELACYERHLEVGETSLNHEQPRRFLLYLRSCHSEGADGIQQRLPVVLLLQPGQRFLEYAEEDVRGLLSACNHTSSFSAARMCFTSVSPLQKRVYFIIVTK
jgi:hypothetical protein